MKDAVYHRKPKYEDPDKDAGKDAMKTNTDYRVYSVPGKIGGALDPNKPLYKDDKGAYTIAGMPKTKAGRGNKYNLKQRGKSAR